MKQKLHDAIDDFVGTLNTMFKISAADFAKNNFHQIVDNFCNDGKTDEENLKAVRRMFESNERLNSIMGNPETAKVIRAFIDGWLDKIKVNG
jgi:hypothetical protein